MKSKKLNETLVEWNKNVNMDDKEDILQASSIKKQISPDYNIEFNKNLDLKYILKELSNTVNTVLSDPDEWMGDINVIEIWETEAPDLSRIFVIYEYLFPVLKEVMGEKRWNKLMTESRNCRLICTIMRFWYALEKLLDQLDRDLKELSPDSITKIGPISKFDYKNMKFKIDRDSIWGEFSTILKTFVDYRIISEKESQEIAKKAAI